MCIYLVSDIPYIGVSSIEYTYEKNGVTSSLTCGKLGAEVPRDYTELYLNAESRQCALSDVSFKINAHTVAVEVCM